MATKAKKGNGKEPAGGPADALRDAVERTFQGAAGGAAATRERATELLDEVTSAVQRLRDARLVETLESLRDELQSLARRVAALERGEGATPAAAKPAGRGGGGKTAAAARKTGAPAKRGTSTSRAKAAAKKSGSAAKPAASKPAAAKASKAGAAKASKAGAAKASKAGGAKASKAGAPKKAASSTRAGTRAPKSGTRRSS